VAKIAQYRDDYLGSKDDAESKALGLAAAVADKAAADNALVEAETGFAAVIDRVGGYILDPARGGYWARTLHDARKVEFIPAASLDDDLDDGPTPAPGPALMGADLDDAMGELLAQQMPKSGIFLPRGMTWADVWRAVADLRQGRRPRAPKGVDEATFFDVLVKIFQAIPLLVPFIKVLADIFGPKPDPNPTPTPASLGHASPAR
jgi:hypothetical protein